MTSLNPKRNADQGLYVTLHKGRIVISIGIDTLGKGFKPRSPYGQELGFDPDQRDYDDTRVKITKPIDFAREVIRALEDEEEDGTTIVHAMLDKACENAIANGAEGIRIGDETGDENDG
jgi:hypothetical protein